MNSAAEPNLLDYPEKSITTDLLELDCEHKVHFCISDQHCWGCKNGDECRFLSRLRTEGKNNPDAGLLTSAYTIINKKSLVKKHGISTCMCDECKWLREAGEFVSL